MAIIDKNYKVELIEGYTYNLSEGQVYEDPLSAIEPVTNVNVIISTPIDLDLGTFDVTGYLSCTQYEWDGSEYQPTENEFTFRGQRFCFHHSSSYTFIREISSREIGNATGFDMYSRDVLSTNCVAFKWSDVLGSVPRENKGSPIYVVKINGASCVGSKELWRLDTSQELQIDQLPQKVDMLGAFANAENLVEISIPPSVKKIGRYSFASTNLTSVRIAKDCTYFPTSFPDNCEIFFYD